MSGTRGAGSAATQSKADKDVKMPKQSQMLRAGITHGFFSLDINAAAKAVDAKAQAPLATAKQHAGYDHASMMMDQAAEARRRGITLLQYFDVEETEAKVRGISVEGYRKARLEAKKNGVTVEAYQKTEAEAKKLGITTDTYRNAEVEATKFKITTVEYLEAKEKAKLFGFASVAIYLREIELVPKEEIFATIFEKIKKNKGLSSQDLDEADILLKRFDNHGIEGKLFATISKEDEDEYLPTLRVMLLEHNTSANAPSGSPSSSVAPAFKK